MMIPTAPTSPAFPAIHGHRGARGLRPENTLEAVRYAISCSANGAEVDLCVTADDVVMVHHDLTLSPLTTRDSAGRWLAHPIPIRALEYQQLQHYNVGKLRPGTAYSAAFPDQQAVDFAEIPTLAAFINCVVAEAPGEFVLNLELKGEPSRPPLLPPAAQYTALIVNSIRQSGVIDRCFLQSFDWQLVRLARELQPGLMTGLLTDMQPDAKPQIPSPQGTTLWTDGMDIMDYGNSVPRMVKAAGSQVWSSNYRDLTPGLIDEAHQLDLLVYVWTVNEKSDMQRMIEWGVDVITTDYPNRLVALRDQACGQV